MHGFNPDAASVMNLRAEAWQLVRYGLTGSCVAAAYLGLFALIKNLTPLSIQLSAAMAMSAAFALSYLGHKRFTFRAEGEHRLYLKRFTVLVIVISVIHTAAMYATEHYAPHYYFYTALAISICIPVISFLANRLLVFNR